MGYKEDLKTARDRAAARLKDALENPKPDYSLDGESMSWTSYQQFLVSQLEALNRAIAAAEPFQHFTRGIS